MIMLKAAFRGLKVNWRNIQYMDPSNKRFPNWSYAILNGCIYNKIPRNIALNVFMHRASMKEWERERRTLIYNEQRAEDIYIQLEVYFQGQRQLVDRLSLAETSPLCRGTRLKQRYIIMTTTPQWPFFFIIRLHTSQWTKKFHTFIQENWRLIHIR